MPNGDEAPPKDGEIQVEFVDHEEGDEGGSSGRQRFRVDPSEREIEPSGAPPPPSPEEELRNQLLRIRADYENLKRRMDRDRDEHRRQAKAQVVEVLLPIMDNMDRALKVLEGEAPEEWCRGLHLVHQQMREALGRLGLVEIAPMGEPFDPTRQEAIASAERDDVPPNTVTAVYEKGYLFEGRLLKAARVEVSRAKAGDPSGEADG